MRLGREAKSKGVRVPVILASDKFISKTVLLVLSQAMASQLQRLPRFVRDHDEFRECIEDRHYVLSAAASVFSTRAVILHMCHSLSEHVLETWFVHEWGCIVV